MHDKIDAVVLAAGQSSRMGQHHKILLPTKDGHTVISLLLSKLLNCVSGCIVVVLGRDADKVQRSILEYDLGKLNKIEFINNPDFEKGMATSLTLGVKAFQETKKGLAVFLADQPLINETEIATLLSAYNNRTDDSLAVAAAKGDKRLNPVIFTPELLSKLQELSGDIGAKTILKKYKEHVALVDLGDGVWSKDIDDWEEYVGLARALNWTDALNFIKTCDSET